MHSTSASSLSGSRRVTEAQRWTFCSEDVAPHTLVSVLCIAASIKQRTLCCLLREQAQFKLLPKISFLRTVLLLILRGETCVLTIHVCKNDLLHQTTKSLFSYNLCNLFYKINIGYNHKRKPPTQYIINTRFKMV